MKKTGLYIGIGVGVLVLGAFAFMMMRKKKEDEDLTKSAEADVDVDAELATTTPAELSTAAAEVAAAKSDEEQLAQLEQLPSTPENEAKKRRLRDKIKAFKNRVAENTRAGRLISAVASQATSNIQQAVQNVAQNIQTRRKCRKEADEKFGFPLKPKKIKEKRDFIKACKDAGGEDFAFSMNEEQYDMFNY